ncbi:zinc finger protein 91-like isoform X2 [Zootermopsis nevadensis]|uniref:zinc finger protein 91-like isoform X2 n=1 Tax=Zootermopsis nevadensis TaxID=136037 RepID=UPI000B8E2B70|nr:zinc finger protein 91-like isoform X2 [Zootermopsis nevadensis]XP_021929233.1 zinc finger protein 91-like isoform X2 [Zootermopsis nevadensis]
MGHGSDVKTKIHHLRQICRIWAERAGCLSLLEKGVDVLHASYRLCSDHFHDASYTSSNKKRLSVHALPEIFPEPSECSEAEDENFRTSLECGDGASLKLYDLPEVHSNLLCRTCAYPSEELIPVFGDKGLELQLLEKIHTHLPVMVTPEDLLPISVCSSCIWKLEMCHELVHTCLEADAKLRAVVGLESNNEGLYSDEYGVESQFDLVHDASSGIKDEPDCDEGACTLDDLANQQQQQLNSVGYVQHADEAQSSYQTFGFINFKQETVEGATDHQFYNAETYNLCNAHVPDSSGDIQHYDQASEHTYNIDEQEYAVDKHLQYHNSDHVKDVIKENPKFKVIIVKLKTGTNMKGDSQTDETVKVLKIVQTSPAVTSDKKACEEQQHPQEQDTECADGHVNELSLELPGLLSSSKKSSNVEGVSRVVFNKTEMLGCSSNNVLDKIPDNSSRESTADLACAHFEQSVSCERNLFSEDNFASDQTTVVCDETLHCAECGIVYASQQLLEKHKRICSNKSGCMSVSENTFLNHKDPSLQPVVFLERLELFSENDNKLKVVENTHNIHVCPEFPAKSHTECALVLPLPENAQTDLASLETSVLNKSKGKNETEIIETFDSHVTPGKNILKQSWAENNSELCKKFETTHRSDTAKIIENINNIIKRNEEILSETATAKLEKSVLSNKELIEKVVKQKPKYVPQIKFEKVHKFWKCLQCFIVFNTERALHDHIRLKHPVIHKCQFCDKQFVSRWRFKQHTSVHTQEKQYMCEFCGKHFRLKRSLHSHLLLHNTEGNKFRCQQCQKNFATKERYTIHCMSHDKASYLCDVCGKSMKYFNSLRVHRRTCIDPGLAQQLCCTICGKMYRDKRGFTDHLRLHTNERPFVCAQCGDSFRMKFQLSYHMLRHTNARQHKCPVCGKGFNHRQHMRVHVLLHQQPCKYICDVCECTFVYMRDFNTHRRNHTKEEIERASKCKRDSEAPVKLTRYICQICGKHLSNRFTLKNHMMTHTEEKPFSCETCGKSFSLTSNLKVHQRIHSSDKPFTCDVCGKRFALKIRLQSHQFAHTGEKPYQCHYCSKRYSFKQNLIIHERMHTGERPFKCCVCSKGFRSQSSLKVHALVHSDQRPFQCMLCDKSFKRRDILHTHQRIHSGECRFLCNVCGRGFKQNGDCKKHERTHFKSDNIQNTLSLRLCTVATEGNNMVEKLI